MPAELKWNGPGARRVSFRSEEETPRGGARPHFGAVNWLGIALRQWNGQRSGKEREDGLQFRKQQASCTPRRKNLSGSSSGNGEATPRVHCVLSNDLERCCLSHISMKIRRGITV